MEMEIFLILTEFLCLEIISKYFKYLLINFTSRRKNPVSIVINRQVIPYVNTATVFINQLMQQLLEYIGLSRVKIIEPSDMVQ